MERTRTVTPTYSVIVLIYHRNKELVEIAKRCIASVKRYSTDYELIIVDNGSTERYDWEKECDTYIRLSENMGISYGWNTGLMASRGEYKVVLGDDTEVVANYLHELRSAMEMPHSGVANVHVEHLPKKRGILEDYKWFSGACFMLTQNTLDTVGYFDEDIFPANHEDWDYWLRCYQKGLKLYRNNRITIKHLEGQTTKADDLKQADRLTNQYFVNKWGTDGVNIFCGDTSLDAFLQTLD